MIEIRVLLSRIQLLPEALGVTDIRRTIGGVRGRVTTGDFVLAREIELKGAEKGAGLETDVTATATAIAIGEIGIGMAGERGKEREVRAEKGLTINEVCILPMNTGRPCLTLFKDIETGTATVPAHLLGMGIGTGLEHHRLEGRREAAETIAKTTVPMEMASQIHRHDETRTRWSWSLMYRSKKMKWRH